MAALLGTARHHSAPLGTTLAPSLALARHDSGLLGSGGHGSSSGSGCGLTSLGCYLSLVLFLSLETVVCLEGF